MIKQVKTKNESCFIALRSASFVKGFNEARKGRPFDYGRDYGEGQWNYERGRLFAFLFHGELKQGKRLTYAAKLAFNDAILSRAIF